MKKINLDSYINALQKRGILFVSKEQVQKDLGFRESNTNLAFSRLSHRKRVFRLRKGFYALVPLEYQDIGNPPPDWFIDPMMAYRNDLYYVGLMSAASLHGATHQQSMEFQVVTNNVMIRDLKTSRMVVRFYKKKNFPRLGLMKVKTVTGYMWVSSPELTAFDLVRYPTASGHLNNIATIFSELGEKIEPKRLKEIASDTQSHRGEAVYWQRMGYLLDFVGFPNVSKDLKEWVDQQDLNYGYLSGSSQKQALGKSEKWKLYINEKLEIDL